MESSALVRHLARRTTSRDSAVASVVWKAEKLDRIVLIRRSDAWMAAVEIPQEIRADLRSFDRDAVGRKGMGAVNRGFVGVAGYRVSEHRGVWRASVERWRVASGVWRYPAFRTRHDRGRHRGVRTGEPPAVQLMGGQTGMGQEKSELCRRDVVKAERRLRDRDHLRERSRGEMQFDEARAAVISEGICEIIGSAGRFRKFMTVGEYTCAVWRSGSKNSLDEFGFHIDTIAFVIRKGRKTVAAGEILVWRPGCWADFDDFRYCCDAMSAEAIGIFRLLRKHWCRPDCDRLVAFGDVIWFKRLFVQSSGGPVPWPTMAEAVFAKFVLERTLMVLEAAPLALNKTFGGYGAQRRWAAALMRLYARALGVRRFGDEAGQNGWMWRV